MISHEEEFQIGDTVCYSEHFLKHINPYNIDFSHDTGVVVTVDGIIGVRWDVERRGIYHDLYGACEPFRGFYVKGDWITRIVDENLEVDFSDSDLEELLR